MPFRGDRLAGIRKQRGIKRGALAKLAGMDRSGLGNIESGKTKNPRGDTIEALAAQLDVTTDYLLGAGPDLQYPEAAVLQALERFKKTEGWKFPALNEAALEMAAKHPGAPNTVSGWRTFVEMAEIVRVGRKRTAPAKTPSKVRPFSIANPSTRRVP